MAKRAAPLTFDDYPHLPPDRRWELVEGVPRVVPSPNTRHQDIVVKVVRLVGNHLDRLGGGKVFVAPFDAVLSDIDVFQPDIVFVSDADMHVLTDDNIRGTPTWVIEVLSNPYYEGDKFDRYEAAGVGEYWLINPYEDTLDISLFDADAYGEPTVHVPPAILRPRCLPSLEIDLGYVLAR